MIFKFLLFLKFHVVESTTPITNRSPAGCTYWPLCYLSAKFHTNTEEIAAGKELLHCFFNTIFLFNIVHRPLTFPKLFCNDPHANECCRKFFHYFTRVIFKPSIVTQSLFFLSRALHVEELL